MKLQLYIQKEIITNLIKGYNQILVDFDGSVNVDKIEDNECEEIIFQDVLDNLSLETHEKLFSTISKKLRLKGRMYFTFTSNSLINFENIEEANEILKANKSVSNMRHIIKLLKDNGLLIENLSRTGAKYELSAYRKG